MAVVQVDGLPIHVAVAQRVTIRFSSAILPPYARRSKRLQVLVSILYLPGELKL
jgi:hypothetical protein